MYFGPCILMRSFRNQKGKQPTFPKLPLPRTLRNWKSSMAYLRNLGMVVAGGVMRPCCRAGCSFSSSRLSAALCWRRVGEPWSRDPCSDDDPVTHTSSKLTLARCSEADIIKKFSNYRLSCQINQGPAIGLENI